MLSNIELGHLDGSTQIIIHNPKTRTIQIKELKDIPQKDRDTCNLYQVWKVLAQAVSKPQRQPVVITVRGGNVEAVYSDASLDVVLLDYDNGCDILPLPVSPYNLIPHT